VNIEEQKKTFLDEVREAVGDDAAKVAARVFEWVPDHGLRDYFGGRNAHGLGYAPIIVGVEWRPAVFDVASTYGHIFLTGEELDRHAPFKIGTKYDELLRRLYEIPEVVRTEKGFYPHVPLAALADGPKWDAFFGVMEWAIGEIKRAAARGLS
jgi:hypothetical protein